MLMNLFVYGTLKSGECNHWPFLGEAAERGIRKGSVHGQLYTFGPPILFMPSTLVFNSGHGGKHEDELTYVNTIKRWQDKHANDEAFFTQMESESVGKSKGEVYSVDHDQLRRVDGLEGFLTNRNYGYYYRVLVPCLISAGKGDPVWSPVWTYVMAHDYLRTYTTKVQSDTWTYTYQKRGVGALD